MDINKTLQLLKEHEVDLTKKPVRFSFKNAEQDFKEIFNYFVPKFKMLPEYKNVINWLKDNQGKGLALLGATGRGKSVILQKVLPVMFMNEFNVVLKPINSYKINKDYQVGRYEVIDEIGNEPTFNDYGIKIELLRYIIDEVEVNNSSFIIAGNINGENFKKRYSEMIYSRVKKMCKIIEFKGENLRI